MVRKVKTIKLPESIEPAHPTVVERLHDFVDIYQLIRDQYQKQIDTAFDRISREIGFVVTTTVPVVMDFATNGSFEKVAIGAEHLKGTLFEKELLPIFSQKAKKAEKWGSLSGSFPIYLIWFDALKLKLHSDWVEPAHYSSLLQGSDFAVSKLTAARTQEALAHVRWDVMEPAHWFTPGLAIDREEAILIEAIDQVYAELHLVDRIAARRERSPSAVLAEVREPAHFRHIGEHLMAGHEAEFGTELAALLKKYGY